MITRLPGDPERRPSRPVGALALGLVLALVIGVWLIQGRDPGTSTSLPPDVPSDAAVSGPRSVSDAPPTTAPPGSHRDRLSGLRVVRLVALPPEAADTVELIERGGPFPYDQDDETFGNFEGILPDRERGYYREYTVETPGSPDRGARRIVAGSEDELYWTADHYDSFARIGP